MAKSANPSPDELLSQAITLLAEWTCAVERGTGWDYWDDHFKDAAYRPGPLRDLIDAERKRIQDLDKRLANR